MRDCARSERAQPVGTITRAPTSGAPTRAPMSGAPTATLTTSSPNAVALLYHNWTSPVPDCTYTGANDYDTNTPTNIEGAFPFKLNDTLACRAWKLAATICTSEPVSYYSNNGSTGANSWNFQCGSSGGFIDPRFGTYCSVANQYICTPPLVAVAAFTVVGRTLAAHSAVAPTAARNETVHCVQVPGVQQHAMRARAAMEQGGRPCRCATALGLRVCSP